MNNIIDNKQCTILWHFDDLKTSHVEPAVVSSVLAGIYAECGKIAKITITWGKVDKYLRMTIDYYLPGKLIVSMIDYIGKVLDNIPEDMKGESSRPASQHLFEIYSSCDKKWWKRSVLACDSFVASSATSNSCCEAGLDDSPFMSSGF